MRLKSSPFVRAAEEGVAIPDELRLPDVVVTAMICWQDVFGPFEPVGGRLPAG